MIRRGASSWRAFTTWGCRPARGGSVITTSGRGWAAVPQSLPDPLFQISRQELAIVHAVEPAIRVGIVHRFRDQFKSHHPAHLGGQGQGDAAGAAVEIPDRLLGR